MGFMEKALQYKREINSRGKETLIDKIQGPAETEMILDDSQIKEIPSDIELDDTFKLNDDNASIGNKINGDGGTDDETVNTLGPEDEPPPFIKNNKSKNDDDSILRLGSEDIKEVVLSDDESVSKGTIKDIESSDNLFSDEKSGKGEPEALQTKTPDDSGHKEKQAGRPHDYMVLYEIGKEIIKAESKKELYDVILFSIMGQIGVSSSSILVPDPVTKQHWRIADFRGITLKNKQLYFDSTAGILNILVKKREVLDMEDYKNIPEYRDEYFNFISVDGRLLAPLAYNGKIFGAILLGEKITIGDYTDVEKDFILSIGEIAAVALHSIDTAESLKNEIVKTNKNLEWIQSIDVLLDTVLNYTDIKIINDAVCEEFKRSGIQSFSVFIRNAKNDIFLPVIVEKEDYLSLEEANFQLDNDNQLIKYIRDIKGNIDVEDFSNIEPISAAFADSRIKKMNIFMLYPFKSGQHLLGFIIIFKVDNRSISGEIDFKISRIARPLILHLLNCNNLNVNRGLYVDNIESIIKRIKSSFISAREMKIPFTMVLFSIKNFKRYYTIYGDAEAKILIDRCEEVITSRLSDTDFAVRIERNKILLVLPGKNKKFAVPLANTIRNEITQVFKKKEMQLMVVHLISEYPEDGDDIYSLLDSIE